MVIQTINTYLYYQLNYITVGSWLFDATLTDRIFLEIKTIEQKSHWLVIVLSCPTKRNLYLWSIAKAKRFRIRLRRVIKSNKLACQKHDAKSNQRVFLIRQTKCDWTVSTIIHFTFIFYPSWRWYEISGYWIGRASLRCEIQIRSVRNPVATCARELALCKCAREYLLRRGEEKKGRTETDGERERKCYSNAAIIYLRLWLLPPDRRYYARTQDEEKGAPLYKRAVQALKAARRISQQFIVSSVFLSDCASFLRSILYSLLLTFYSR